MAIEAPPQIEAPGTTLTTPPAVGATRDHVRHLLAARTLLVLCVCAGAYHHSLVTLLRGLSQPTPAAYLGLVPLISLLLFAARAAQTEDEPDIHDRYLDWIVGLPLLAAALAILGALPIQLSTYFWLWRLDLLSLPLFVSGAIVLAFGARALWRLRVPIAFLGLAWPAPYVLLANGRFDLFTAATLAVLRQLTAVLPVARPLAAGGGSLFGVTHAGRDAVLSVGAASAGADSVLGFLLVGLAIAALASGPLIGRVAWLMAGATVVWLLNLARILALFALLALSGAGAVQLILEPLFGLVAFNLGALAMIAALPRFGLRIDIPALARRLVGHLPARAGIAHPRRPAARRVPLGLAVLVVAGALGGAADAGLRQFELVATPLGQPLRQPSAVSSRPVPGWAVRKTASYSWITTYLGRDASWDRYQYSSATPPLEATENLSPITLDLFTTLDGNALATYGLEGSYHLHGYRLLEATQVGLGGGVVGDSVVYRSRVSSATWTAVYWEWPVETSSGTGYERVVLHPANPTEAGSEARARDLLAGFSRQVVLASAGRPG